MQTDRTRASRADGVALLFLLAVSLPWVSAFFGWKHFRQELNLLDIKPWTWGDLPLVWVDYAKAQVVLLPAFLLAMLMIAARWRRSGITLFLLWTALVFIWIEADQQTYTRTNIHVLSYLQYAGDAGANQWAGGSPWANLLDVIGGAKPILLLSLAVAGGMWGLNLITRRLVSPTSRKRLAAGLAAAYITLFIAVVPAQRQFPDRRDLQRLHAIMPFDMTWSAIGLHLVDTSDFADPFNDTLSPVLRKTIPILATTQPADTQARIDSGPKPNVVLIVIESLREDALVPDVMPRLSKLSETGLRLRQHYAGSRMSHLGMFNLLMGRTAADYYLALLGGATVTPQACITLKNSGYQTTYTASADHRDWVRMGQFISDTTFDQMNLFHAKSWITRDGRTLHRVKEILESSPRERPQFITAFVASTHFPYIYPPEFGTRTPCLPEKFRFMSLTRENDMPRLRNRYLNSCAFMDHQVAELIATLDLKNTLFIVTGDHGESLLDDGAMAHGGRWSDSQLRVPCFFRRGGRGTARSR